MREMILKRLSEIRSMEGGFSRLIYKWDEPLSHGILYSYVDEFDKLFDNDLLFIYERIIMRLNKVSVGGI